MKELLNKKKTVQTLCRAKFPCITINISVINLKALLFRNISEVKKFKAEFWSLEYISDNSVTVKENYMICVIPNFTSQKKQEPYGHLTSESAIIDRF